MLKVHIYLHNYGAEFICTTCILQNCKEKLYIHYTVKFLHNKPTAVLTIHIYSSESIFSSVVEFILMQLHYVSYIKQNFKK